MDITIQGNISLTVEKSLHCALSLKIPRGSSDIDIGRAGRTHGKPGLNSEILAPWKPGRNTHPGLDHRYRIPLLLDALPCSTVYFIERRMMMRRFSLILLLTGLTILAPLYARAQKDDTQTSRASGNENTPKETPIPKTAKALESTALSDLAAWRHAEARKTLKTAKKDFGDTPEFATAWGYLLAEEKNLKVSISTLSDAVERNPTSPIAPYLLGEVHSWKKEKAAAKKAWTIAKQRAAAWLKTDPDNGEANYWMGAVLLKLGKIQDAGKYLEKARKSGFSPALTSFQIGLYESARKKWNEALEAFNHCLEEDGGFAHAYYYRARIFGKLGKKSEMLIDLDRFLKLAPDAREAAAAKALLNNGG